MPFDLNQAGPQQAEPEKKTPQYDADALNRALKACADRWVPEIFPRGREDEKGHWRLANIRGEPPKKSGSCIVYQHGERAGDWHEFDDGSGGGPLSTLKEGLWLRDGEVYKEATALIEKHGATSYLNPTYTPTYTNGHDKRASKENKSERELRQAADTLSQSGPIEGTLGETYLRARGITFIPPTGDLLFNDNTTDWETHTGEPALIARFRYPDGRETGGIHRIYLKRDGSAHGPKKMLGPVGGGVVMLAQIDANGELGVGEGIESTAAGMQIYGLPGWAAASADGMRKLADWLTARDAGSIKSLTIFADRRRAGETAAQCLARAALAAGIDVVIRLPNGPDDFADDLHKSLPRSEITLPNAPAAEIIGPPATLDDVIAHAERLAADSDSSAIAAVLARAALLGDDVAANRILDIVKARTRQPIDTLRKMLRAARKSVGGQARATADVALDGPWRGNLQCYDDFQEKPWPTLANAARIIRMDSAFLVDGKSTIRMNEFTGIVTLAGWMPWEKRSLDAAPERFWTEADTRAAAEFVQQRGVQAGPAVVFDAVMRVAEENIYHPVREYLDALKWDGQARLDNWLNVYCGVAQTPLAIACGARFLLSAVARIFEPGERVDTALILEGLQDLGKSSVFRTLAGPYFVDEIAELGSKDAALQMRGAWIIELAELDAMSRAEVSRIKAFMSRSKDRFRPPYGRSWIEQPRQCVFGGTTNDYEYLKDDTGGRRWWPFAATKIKIALLRQDRDQLWAEAAHRYRQHERHWLHEDDLKAAHAKEIRLRTPTEAWDAEIERWLKKEHTDDTVTVAQVLYKGLFITDRSKWSKADQMKVAKCLRNLGWDKDEDARPRCWRRPGKPRDPREELLKQKRELETELSKLDAGVEREPGEEG